MWMRTRDSPPLLSSQKTRAAQEMTGPQKVWGPVSAELYFKRTGGPGSF